VLASLADGDSVEQVLASLPTLTEEQARAAISLSATSVEEEPPLPGLLPWEQVNLLTAAKVWRVQAIADFRERFCVPQRG